MAKKARRRRELSVEVPFNPLDKANLGESVADAMLRNAPARLPLEESFIAAGIYALYYVGGFPLYANITKHNMNNQFKWPIYVGKAVPPGSRKGGFGLGENPGTVLKSRIREHERSIEQSKNLGIEHFYCRYLAVEDIWIPLGESLLIEQTSPLWNKALDGFGIHKPGEGRGEQALSLWDTIHPGRKLAEGLPPNKVPKTEIVDAVEQSIASHPLNSRESSEQ